MYMENDGHKKSFFSELCISIEHEKILFFILLTYV